MVGKAVQSTTLVLTLSIVLSLFVAFNGQASDLKIAMLAYAVASAIILVFVRLSLFPKMNIIDQWLESDSLLGIGVGVGLILVNKATGLVIGIPLFIGLEDIVLFIAVVVIAPIVEEFLFRSFLLGQLVVVYGRVFGNLIQAFAFAMFHLLVYGGLLGLVSSPALFVSVGVIGLLFGFLVQNGDNYSLNRVIIPHAIFNFFVLNLTGVFLAIT